MCGVATKAAPNNSVHALDAWRAVPRIVNAFVALVSWFNGDVAMREGWTPMRPAKTSTSDFALSWICEAKGASSVQLNPSMQDFD